MVFCSKPLYVLGLKPGGVRLNSISGALDSNHWVGLEPRSGAQTGGGSQTKGWVPN